MFKSKIPYEKKAEIVKDYLDGRVGYAESLKRENCGRESFRCWVHLYKEKGAAWLLPNSRNKVYPANVKRKAVCEYLSGHGSLQSICEKYEIRSTSQLCAWIKVYHAHGDFNARKNSGGGSCMAQGRSTTHAERVQIVKDCLASGKNYGEMDYILGRTESPKGAAYENHVNIGLNNPEMARFVEMCFDPGSAMNERLKATLVQML